MFSEISEPEQIYSAFKAKRDQFHQSRVRSGKEKVKNSIRFETVTATLVAKDKQDDYNFIIQMDYKEVEPYLRELIEKGDLMSLPICIFRLQKRPEPAEKLLSRGFINYLVKSSVDLMHQPQMAFTYKIISTYYDEFYNIVFDNMDVVRSVVKEITSFKQGFPQQTYIEILTNMISNYTRLLKLYEVLDNTSQLFKIVSELFENDTVSFQNRLRIMKDISHFISEKNSLSPQIVGQIVEYYEQNEDRPSLYFPPILNSFIILIKVIYYQQNLDIITSLRMIKIVLSSRGNLPPRIVEQYYNTYVLIGKLIKNIEMFEVEKISKKQFEEYKEILTKKYKMKELKYTEKEGYLTTVIVNHLLNQYPEIMEEKQLEVFYLYLMYVISNYCIPEVVMHHFIKADFFHFLIYALDHIKAEFNVLAIDILVGLMGNEVENSQILAYMKDYYNFPEMLKPRLISSGNGYVHDKIHLIFERYNMSIKKENLIIQ